jgi:response regulator RpfG family c-di-GMP phosphodiesterase
MSTEQEYFHIEIEMFKEEIIFPFQLFVFHPVSLTYSPFLHANSPLDDQKKEFLDFILGKGGELAVIMTQKRTFLTHLEMKEEDVPSLREEEKTELELKKEELEKQLAEENSEGTFIFQSKFADAVKEGNYMPIIDRAKLEIMTFSVRVNQTVSLARYFAEKLMSGDTHTNRVVAVSYFLAKNCDVMDEQSLGDLVCASFLAHIGLTQYDSELAKAAQVSLTGSERKLYEQHAGLSHHLIRKSDIMLTPRCVTIINTHHERFDGSGFPSSKKGTHIDILALILGAVSHIFEYSSGQVTGEQKAIPGILNNLKNKTFTPGLEFEFGDTIYENLIHLIGQNVEAEDSSPNEENLQQAS